MLTYKVSFMGVPYMGTVMDNELVLQYVTL